MESGRCRFKKIFLIVEALCPLRSYYMYPVKERKRIMCIFLAFYSLSDINAGMLIKMYRQASPGRKWREEVGWGVTTLTFSIILGSGFNNHNNYNTMLINTILRVSFPVTIFLRPFPKRQFLPF